MDTGAERTRSACDREAIRVHQDSEKWNRVEPEWKRTRCHPDSAARHGIGATQQGNVRQIAPITLNERRLKWHVRRSTGNRRLTAWYRPLLHGNQAVMPYGRQRQHGIATSQHGITTCQHGITP